ncbi:hypothetical protein HMPREF9021_02688 [Simonsiella muelleri ATCC 29453]|uniref:Uncharacterized protein n=2 Tax=Simonsiella TaxID=71 RepID=U6Q3C5_9NEIS|nr:hypothetical protein HMPREF9021_02688 [Simonsiella muelleri ATCC 29453]
MLFCIEMLHHKNQTLPSYNGSVERKTASGRRVDGVEDRLFHPHQQRVPASV